MPNDNLTPILPRLLIALLSARLPAKTAAAFSLLASSLAQELPLRSLVAALVRLRGHLRSDERALALSSRAEPRPRPDGAGHEQ